MNSCVRMMIVYKLNNIPVLCELYVRGHFFKLFKAMARLLEASNLQDHCTCQVKKLHQNFAASAFIVDVTSTVATCFRSKNNNNMKSPMFFKVRHPKKPSFKTT